MKRDVLIIFFLAIFFGSQAQTLTVSVPTVTATVGQIVYIPVKLSGASSSGMPISGANIQITYDTAVLHYDTLTNFYSAMPQNQWFFGGQLGLVSANWLEPSLNTLAIPDNTVLYEIKFHYKGGNSPLTFTTVEFTDAQYNLIPTLTVNGAVNAPVVFRQVTFKVDMSKENITSSGVHIAGSFNNWNYAQTAMSLLPNSIYQVTLTLQENVAYQYRFVNGNTISGVETVPASCGVANGTGQYNRQITVPNHDTTYSAVCFSMCSHCPASVSVTFRVDMQNQTVSPNGVHLSGTFNNWNYAQTLMTSNGGTIYETTMTMDEGTYMEFRYANGITSQQSETVPAACSLNGNRYFTVPAHDTVMTAYCFGSCTACGTVAHYSHVTFRVDLITQHISPDGVHISGTFQGWNPAATPMINSVDSVFSYTDSLLTGTSVQYKFVNGNSTAGHETVPLACASNGNRTLLVPANDTILNLVCFSQCDSCVLTGIAEAGRNDFELGQNFPNPCSLVTNIGYHINREGTLNLMVYSPMGRVVAVLFNGPCKPGAYTLAFQTNSLPAGIYFYKMIFTGEAGTQLQSKKMIIQ
ncbi:MAG: cohesin domain-containing protein [Bacteroidetes bacterium]|nr:cohesin domain-containing protein [Bacteroidota bacterium]